MRQYCGKIVGIVFAAIVLFSAAAMAQSTQDPLLPPPLRHLVDEGAQMRYLGRANGLDGWIAIKSGQEQYFYVTPDGQGFVMGLLFDKDGKLMTVRQVQALQQSSGAETLDMFAMEDLPQAAPAGQEATQMPGANTSRDFKTPAEQLYTDVEGSNWVALGSPTAPYIYTFIDPQCPFCHAFINELRRDYIENGLIQVRMIPVGFKEDTRAQAAFLLAVPNPQTRWYSHLDGEADALPVSQNINQQGVQRNLSVMQSWKMDATPFTVYRSRGGEVKIVKGKAQDIKQIISDIATN